MRNTDTGGKLSLVATPIGNLEDMTFRAVRILKEADLIAAEDTRNSIRLLNHFGIGTKMTSYHEYNKYDKAEYLVDRMLEGLHVALITDAGTPGISDPGEELVRKCLDNGIPVTSIPGASACVTALSLSGQPTRRFVFEAFLPNDKKERKRILDSLVNETRTIILYEAPHHLKKTLDELYSVLGNREMTICRELTKKYETINKSNIIDMISYYRENEPRGEYVLVIHGKDYREIEEEERKTFEEMSIEEHMEIYEQKGMDRKAAMKAVAKDRGVSKRDIYQYLNT